jgi:predicted metal-dependent hydrolase
MDDNRTIRRPDGLRVKFRRMRFDFEEYGFDRYWHGGSPFKSLFWSQLSTAFEPGERFFIDSARALKDHLHDPRLLDELAEFCKQEGHHTLQHLKFDRINAEMGVDVETCRRRYARVLDWVRGKLDPLQMLAVTSALEHFTAGLAQQLFSRPEIGEGADPRVNALWKWHAAEEAEHKATCHDIYRQLKGGEGTRLIAMPIAWFLIVTISLVNTVTLLRRDKKLFRVKDFFGGLRYLFGRRGFLSGMVPSFFAYFSPHFHPWKEDNAAVIALWQAENERYIQNLDKLQPAAAALASA